MKVGNYDDRDNSPTNGVLDSYIIQERLLGLAHAAGCAREFDGDDDFVIYLGDNILKQGIATLKDL